MITEKENENENEKETQMWMLAASPRCLALLCLVSLSARCMHIAHCSRPFQRHRTVCGTHLHLNLPLNCKECVCVCVCTIVHIANAYSRSHTHMETWEELPWIGMRLSIDNLVAIYLKLMGF